MKLLKKVGVTLDRAIDFGVYLACIILAFVCLLVCTEVALRSLAGRSLIWVVQIARYCLLYITFLGAAWLLKNDGHVRMDAVLNRLDARTQSLLNSITSIICAIVCLFLVWYGVEVALRDFHSGYFEVGALGIRRVFIIAIIPVGCFLLFIQFLRKTYGYLRSWMAVQDKG